MDAMEAVRRRVRICRPSRHIHGVVGLVGDERQLAKFLAFLAKGLNYLCKKKISFGDSLWITFLPKKKKKIKTNNHKVNEKINNKK